MNTADSITLHACVHLGTKQVLKLDVEGFEPHVTRGAHQLLSSHKVNYIISEFNKV